MPEIDLDQVTDGGASRNLAGKERGEAARAYFHLNELDQVPDVVIVRAPEYLINISSSYFLGMFSPSIQHLGGEENFLRKYQFEAPQHIRVAIRHGIDRAVASRTRLRVSGAKPGTRTKGAA
jgi:hypothetical protein